MHPSARLASFGGDTGRNLKGNVVVPIFLGDEQLDAAEGGASFFGISALTQGDRQGVKPLRTSTNGTDLLSPDASVSNGKTSLGDTSVSYGKQQGRLTAQLAAKQLRRPSQLRHALHSRREGEEVEEDEVGPWGILRKDRQAQTWRSRLKQRLKKLSHWFLIRPGNPWLQKWFYVCVVMALLSGWEVPFHFAFLEPGGLLRPYYDWVAVVEYVSTAVFFADFLLKFSLMYIDIESGLLVSSRRKIARRYIKSWQFYMDLLGWFPLDWVSIDTAAALGAGEGTLNGLAWIKLLTLVRIYRVFELFTDLDYRMVISQGALLLSRNYTYVFFTTHWAACGLYHVAAHQTFSPASWVGRNAERFVGRPTHERYLLSLYFSVSAFTGLGDAALFAGSVPEAAFMVLYLLFNLFLGAYILGTVTMLVVKGDERSKAFRERMSNLNDFSRNNDLPARLHNAMQEHLEVTFNTEQVDDEHVLAIYPTTIRRKVLRHLYLAPVRGCYLFRGCKQRFLDALLTAARVELFMPGVQLMIEGDNVTELNVIVSGDVLVAEAGINLSAAFSQFASATATTADPSNRGSRRFSASSVEEGGGGPEGGGGGGTKRVASIGRAASLGRSSSMGGRTASGLGRTSSCNGSIKDFLIDGANGFMEMATGKKVMTRYSGDALAEVPFFTDVPSNETIMTQSVVRVLVIPKHSWDDLMDAFPQQTRLVLANLQARMEAALSSELTDAAEACGLSEEALRAALIASKGQSKNNGSRGGFLTSIPQESAPPVDLTELLPQTTLDLLNRLDDARALVRTHCRKVDQLRTFEFLGAASDGDIEELRAMLAQGMNPGAADYDGRTGLMLAASGGHEAVVRLLLDSGAKSDQLDAFGTSAMCEAVKNAHDNVIDVLLSYGATLAMDPMAVASSTCTAVFEGDLVKLRRLLRSGAPPDACDYDKRSALHIAGAEGNLAAVKLLVEEGGADPGFQDRWGNTALDEARRVGATPVVAYLEGLLSGAAGEQLVGSGIRHRQRVGIDFLAACGTGDVARVRYIAANSHPGCIFTGLVLAASKGYKDVAELLLSWVPSDILHSEGHMALVAAARMGHSGVVAALRANGLALTDPRDAVLLGHMRAAVQSVDLRAVSALLAAGVDVREAAGEGSGALLHAAAATGSLELVRRLVEEGGMRPNADSAGRTPAAVAEAARLTPVADYLSWATTAGGGGLGVAASPSAAVGGLAAAAAARFGPLPDYSAAETHDELSHGVTAPEPLSATDDDDEPPPTLLAKMASFNSVASSRTGRLTRLGSLTRGSLTRQTSMPRGNALWRLSSLARAAGDSAAELSDPQPLLASEPQQPRKPGQPGQPRARRASLTSFVLEHRLAASTNGSGPPNNTAMDAAAATSNARHRHHSHHQAVDPEAELSALLSRGGKSGGGAGAGRRPRRGSTATAANGGGGGGGATSISSNVIGGGSGGGPVSGTSSKLRPSVLGFLAELLTGGDGGATGGPTGSEVASLADFASAPAAATSTSTAAATGQSSIPTQAATTQPQCEASPMVAAAAAAVSGGGGGNGGRATSLSFVPSTPPEGPLEGGNTARAALQSPGSGGSGSGGGATPFNVLDTCGDALESYLQVLPSSFSSSRPAAAAVPPPPPVGGITSGGGGGGTVYVSSCSGTGGALAEGEWSHRALEKRLTALCPPER